MYGEELDGHGIVRGNQTVVRNLDGIRYYIQTHARLERSRKEALNEEEGLFAHKIHTKVQEEAAEEAAEEEQDDTQNPRVVFH